MKDNTAKVVATAVVWVAVACIFILGIFSSDWRPMMNLPFVLVSAILLLCVTALGATAAVWNYKLSAKKRLDIS